ncbi:fumarylacetoacetate hydrolase family protein [Bacillus marinisedimentorum]|uniref:fumarylacetoacetate hydrolase family protein n=1 Tax=Bacillus marinisedimentorum TaxID=1821260 RepID=UPI0007E07451|nr:fumarylacetoacetate hydrolase family protein [Bacillus marinisedimentorum]
MRFATMKHNGEETAAVVTENGLLAVKDLNEASERQWPADLFSLIQPETFIPFIEWFTNNREKLMEQYSGKMTSLETAEYGPLYRHPRKIWGIGLNYVEHASDLHEKAPNTEPASFMKPDTTIIGPGDTIKIPEQSDRTTAEAELGIVIGRTCKDVSEAEALDMVAGYTTIIDMTAEDILQKNPRYLTRSKSFDTFFSFGPQLVTPDEVKDLAGLQVTTVLNGKAHRTNTISNMTFSPEYLVSFHSKVMTLLPGDIISTGTPGAAVIRNGDVVRCEIEGFAALENGVVDLKG